MDPTLRDKLQALRLAALKVQAETASLGAEILDQLRADGQNISEALYTDCGYLLREIHDHLDEARKEAEAKKVLISRLLAFVVTKRLMSNPASKASAEGLLAIGIPDCKQRPIVPKAGTPDFQKLMDFFGVKNADVEKFGILTFHWPKLSEYLNALAADGRNPPPGLGMMQPEYVVAYRAKTPV